MPHITGNSFQELGIPEGMLYAVFRATQWIPNRLLSAGMISEQSFEFIADYSGGAWLWRALKPETRDWHYRSLLERAGMRFDA